uniref:Uncharacterized protein n=1 Tax=Octopus bimaculoides TaxID=37653 RepID=A0A0L8H9N8_OCTBM
MAFTFSEYTSVGNFTLIICLNFTIFFSVSLFFEYVTKFHVFSSSWFFLSSSTTGVFPFSTLNNLSISPSHICTPNSFSFAGTTALISTVSPFCKSSCLVIAFSLSFSFTSSSAFLLVTAFFSTSSFSGSLVAGSLFHFSFFFPPP